MDDSRWMILKGQLSMDDSRLLMDDSQWITLDRRLSIDNTQ